MTDETTARDRAIEADRCPSCEHRREFHSEPGCWHAVTVGTPDKPLNCPCSIVDWPAAPEGAPTADVAESKWDPSDLTVMGEYICAAVGRCTCGPFDGQHEQHCGYEPIAYLSVVRDLLAAPEGVDAADELAEAEQLRQAEDYFRWFAMQHEDVNEALVGRVLAEYDERGRELAAAQAAIQRVRELHVDTGEDYCSTCGPAYHTICCGVTAWPCPTVRALDGDADEEKR